MRKRLSKRTAEDIINGVEGRADRIPKLIVFAFFAVGFGLLGYIFYLKIVTGK